LNDVKYGLLCYNLRRNLGDEIQSIAARQFLPRVDYLIDRDRISEYSSPFHQPVVLICNGWFGHRPENWPPPVDISPLFVSMHFSTNPGGGMARISARDFMLNEHVASYLKMRGPVGARDLYTLRLLEDASVPAYFSGCLTLTLMKSKGIEQKDFVVLNDVPANVVAHVMQGSKKQILLTSHDDTYTFDADRRLEKAQTFLNYYQSAICVITSRLHCALPCLALGTPVLLIDMAKDKWRFSGLHNLVRNCSLEDFLSGKYRFDVDNPEPNPEEHLSLRAHLREAVCSFIEASANGSADLRQDESWLLRSRFQTLLSIHAEQNRRLSQLESKIAKPKGVRKLVSRILRGRSFSRLHAAMTATSRAAG
jgi:polysaccharide pyruvyl transferase